MDLAVFLRVFNFFYVGFPNGDFQSNSTGAYSDVDSNFNSKVISVGNSKEHLINIKPDVDEDVNLDCRGVLGCFPTGPPFRGPERPVSLPPQHLDHLQPFFCLHSGAEPQCQKLFPGELQRLGSLDVSPDTFLIVVTHGFLDSTEKPWIQLMVNSLLKNLEDNTRVLALDWRNGASPPYAQAVANIRLMGAVVGRLLYRLQMEKGLKLSRTHLIGHSLGAHLFGYAGSYINGLNLNQKLGRITGLEPAGVYFRGTPPVVRLDSSDGFLVDVFHTDSTSLIPTLPVSLGLPEATGHLDFFPNGGGQQKGCPKSLQEEMLGGKRLGEGFLEFMSCSHQRAHQYFTATVDKRCQYIGVECESWATFQAGKCWNCHEHRCFLMGMTVRRVYPASETELTIGGRTSEGEPEDVHQNLASGEDNLNLFLAITSDGKFCGDQRRFTLVMSNSSEAIANGDEYARVSIVIRGKNTSFRTFPREGAVLLSPGDCLHWVDAIPRSVGPIRSMVLSYENEGTMLSSLVFRIRPPAIFLREIHMESLLEQTKTVFYLCEEKILFGDSAILKKKC